MITLRKGSHALSILTLLSVVGEFPASSLHLLGKERVIKALVHKMQEMQSYRFSQTDPAFTCKLLKISGRGKNKSIRLCKAALPLLEKIPGASEYYTKAFWNHKLPGDDAHRDRNFRVAESIAMSMAIGIECRPYLLPRLQNTKISLVVPEYPVYYLAKELKKLNESEMNKTMFTRMTGALISNQSVYAVYNTRNAIMKWNGMGEFKALHNLMEISRMNAGVNSIDSAVLFGTSEEVALRTLQELPKSHRIEFRFDSIYKHVYFVPMDPFGMRLLRLFTIPEWKSQLLDLLFPPESQSGGTGVMEYDAYINSKYIYSHLDGDIARLVRLREALQIQNQNFEVLSFPEQLPLLREYLGPHVNFKTIDMESVEEAMGLEGGERLEGSIS